MFANKYVPQELVSILHQTAMGIDASYVQELFMKAAAERQVTHKIFGMTKDELTHVIAVVASFTLLGVLVFGSIMIALLVRQTKRAHKAAAIAEDHAQAKTRFLAMMSHELRTPLNAVIGFAEFMSDPTLDEAKRREYTDGILISSNALLDLINDILDLSKLEAGAMDMRSGACDVASLLRELPAIFGYRVRRHGVKLRIEAPPAEQLPIVELAQQGVRQILINLVGNAAKFTEQGEIVIRASWDAENRNLHFEVSDTGCGISPEKLDKIFDPFVQDIASRMKSSAGEIKGTGLGLPIVKRMVDNAGGTVHATSELGKGTTFVIDIPNLVVVQNISNIPRAAEQTIREVLPERVLVVDDMTMNRKILGIHLANHKIRDVRYAENGEKAIEIMNEWVPDLVLTDMWMPKMDGTQLAEAMRKDRRLAEIPIVAVTADVDVGSTYDMSLFAKVISKPVTNAKLTALFGEVATSL
jgi:signal transduction histidine kinase